MKLKPSDIHFSQDSISNTFGKKTQHRNTYTGETLDELINGTATVFSIPTISVFQYKGKWLISDNRRLWVFRMAEELGILRSIPVSEILLSMIGIKNPKLNTKNGGLSVSVRGNDPGGHTWRRLIEEKSRNQYHNSTHHSNRMERISNYGYKRENSRQKESSTRKIDLMDGAVAVGALAYLFMKLL